MAELEKKLRTLEVSGLWSLPGKLYIIKLVFLFFFLIKGSALIICKEDSTFSMSLYSKISAEKSTSA